MNGRDGGRPGLAGGRDWGWLDRRRVLAVVALALFALVFVARLAVDDELAVGAALYALPIALVAVAFGAGWGLAAAGLGLLLFGVWDRLEGAGASPLAYLTGGLAFALLGGLLGLFAGRLRGAGELRAGETAAAERADEHGRRMGAVVEQAREAAIGLSPQGRILSWNPGAEQVLGYAAGEVLGRQVELLVPPQLRERDLATVAAALERGETVHLETVRRRKDGSEVPVALVAAPLLGGHGRPVGSIAVLTDLTEQRRQQALLQEARERFESAFGAAAIGMALVAPDGRLLQVNQALCELTGHREAELLDKTLLDISHPDDRQLGLAELAELQAGERRRFQLEKRYLRADGEPVWCLLSVSAVRDAEGQFRYSIAQLQDVTARRRAELELRRAARFFELSRDIVCELGFDGYFKQLGRMWTATLGWREDELMARPFLDFVHPDDRQATAAEAERLKSGGASSQFTNRYRARVGGWRWFEWTALGVPQDRLIYAAARD
jgi:PAS domain S-box-containing protein